MKKTYNLLLASILVITLLSLFSVSVSAIPLTATNVTINLPTTSALISGDQVFNLSLIAGYTDQNWTKIIVYARSAALTANTTAAKAILTPSLSENTTALNFNGTLGTTAVEDATDYTLTFALRNGTSEINKTVAVTVDNTIPSTPTLTPATNTIYPNGSIDFSGAVTATRTTACTLYFDGTNYQGASHTMTHSGSTCTLSLTGVPDGTYKWYIGNQDGTNTTNSATAEVHVDTTNSKPGIYGENVVVDSQGFVVTGTDEKTLPSWIVPLIVMIAVIGIGYWIAKRK